MKVCPKGATVVIELTVSPGTIDKFVRPVIEGNGFVIGQDIHLVHAPERIYRVIWYMSYCITIVLLAQMTKRLASK